MLFRLLLSKKKRGGQSAANPNGWMMSYADMATTLLAMFIVLSALGKDQTGLSLYNGTGSFFHSLDTFGAPGLFPRSSRVIDLKEPGPHYQGLPPDGGPNANEAADPLRVIDLEEERLQRFLQEMDRQFQVDKLPRLQGQAVFDFYDPLNKKPPYLAPRHAEVLGQVAPVLWRAGYQVTIIVWATMPSESAWLRAANQAQLVAGEVAVAAGLDGPARARLLPLGQPWRHRDLRRPVLSLVISKRGTTS